MKALIPVGERRAFPTDTFFVRASARDDHPDQRHYLAMPGGQRIDYALRPAASQARHQGRIALEPQVDLAAYEFRATVDFVTLCVEASCRYPTDVLSAAIRKGCSVQCGVTMAPAGRRYHLKLQDPTRFSMTSLLTWIEAQSELNYSHVDEVELALDVYATANGADGEDARWQMVDLLWRHLLPPADVYDLLKGAPRCTTEKGNAGTFHRWTRPRRPAENGWIKHRQQLLDSGRGVAFPANTEFFAILDPSSYQPSLVNGTSYLGSRNGDVLVKIMHKIKDRQNLWAGTVDILPAEERRARVEVTLRSAGFDKPLTTDLLAHSFRAWGKRYFRFWLPTLPLGNGIVAPDAVKRFERGGVYATARSWDAERTKRKGIEYLSSAERGRLLPDKRDEFSDLLAYHDLNERRDKALKRLETRWR